MALTKDQKQEIIAQYTEWVKESNALVFTEYTGLNMADFDELRAEIRKAGGEFHVVKNTLMKRAFADAGLELADEVFVGSTAMGVAFDDPPAVAKAIKDFGKQNKAIKLKGGVMDGNPLSASEVNTLAELPPLPVVQAQLLGVLNAPATKLVGVLNEPGASLARVVKAYADNNGAEAAA